MTGQTTGRLLSVLAMALLAGLVALLSLVAPAETLPGGFSDTKFASAHLPTALAFTPDGRMLVTSKSGELYLYDEGGDRIPNAASGDPWSLKLSVCANSERGLLGVAVDPDFEMNNFIYLYYTDRRAECPDKEPGDPGNPYNRVSRFEMNGDVVDKSSEKVLIDGIPSPNGNHNGGDLHFGNDEKLYVSVGDGACDYAEKTRCQYENDAARDNHVLLGKILRIEPDGTIPADNPYAGQRNSARCSPPPVDAAAAPENPGISRTEAGDFCKETFVKGFRNPFRFAVDYDAEGTRLFINDVGGQRWEEVDEAVFGPNNTLDSGNDYGWNICEGRHDNPYRGGRENCDSATKTAPIHEYNHSTGCESVTAGTFVPNNSNWPAEYRDDYLYGDFVCGRIFSLSPKNDGGYARDTFIGGLGIRSAVAMTFGPHKDTQALYYATFEGNGGSIRRVAYTEGNQSPVADLKTAGNNYGDADPNASGFQIDFDAAATDDPDGDGPLTYMWAFGDGSSAETTTPTTTHPYEQRGKYTVTLTVKDGEGAVSEPATIEVFPGDEPPQPTITEAPTEFQVGETHTARGTATDPDTGPVTLSWQAVQVHDNNHEHPLQSAEASDRLMFNGPPAEGLYSTDPDENYVVVRLTATDSLGLSKTIERVVRPETVQLTFRADPSNLKIRVGGEQVRGQSTVTAWVGDGISVTAPRQQDRDGRVWAFRSWSDGGPATHTITAPEDPKTYTATFRRASR